MPISRDEFEVIMKELNECVETFQIGSYYKKSAVQIDIAQEILEKHIVADNKLTVERVKGVIEDKMQSLSFEISRLKLLGLSVERIQEDVSLLIALLKEINEAENEKK